jgi:UPF0716 family protein affecting phage T7 exclusion
MFVVIPYLLLELYLSLHTGEQIGFFWSVVWIVLSATFGSILLKNSPHAISNQMKSVQMGKLNLKKFQDASMSYFVGSLLLIVPGVLSDFMGLIAITYTIYLQFIAKITPENSNVNSQFKNFQTKQGDSNVIDVEIIDEHTDSISRS